MGKDYYDILGVSKDADETALKKGTRRRCCTCGFASILFPPKLITFKLCRAAYKTLAMKYHPVRHIVCCRGATFVTSICVSLISPQKVFILVSVCCLKTVSEHRASVTGQSKGRQSCCHRKVQGSLRGVRCPE